MTGIKEVDAALMGLQESRARPWKRIVDRGGLVRPSFAVAGIELAQVVIAAAVVRTESKLITAEIYIPEQAEKPAWAATARRVRDSSDDGAGLCLDRVGADLPGTGVVRE